MKLVRVLMTIGVAACGPNDEAFDDGGNGSGSGLDVTQSGSRIKARVLSTPDGAKAFDGWVDTQRNEDCAFALPRTA